MSKVRGDDGLLPRSAGLARTLKSKKRTKYTSFEEYTGETDLLSNVRPRLELCAQSRRENVSSNSAKQNEVVRDSVPHHQTSHRKIPRRKLEEDTISNNGEAPIVRSSLTLQPTAVANNTYQQLGSRHESQGEQRILPNCTGDSSLPKEKTPGLERKGFRELAVPVSASGEEQDTHAGGPRTSEKKRNRYSTFDYMCESGIKRVEGAKAEGFRGSGPNVHSPGKVPVGKVGDAVQGIVGIPKPNRAGSLDTQESETHMGVTAVGLPGSRSDSVSDLKVVPGIAALGSGSGASRNGIPVGSGCTTRDTSTISRRVRLVISKRSLPQLHGDIEIASAHGSMSGHLSALSAGITTGRNVINDEGHANDSPTENIRPTQQNLRYGAYPGQPAPQTRNTPLGTARLQNSSNKLGNGTAWGFGAPANGALPSAQPRPTGVGSTSFAQTIGGSQPAASLDITDFPSLGPTSQSQYQNTSQSIWANQRAAQQTPVQRPQQQQQHAISSQASQQRQQAHHAQDQPQRVNENVYSSTSHLHSGVDDDRYHNTLGQIPTARQPPTTSVDDFPPLGRHGTDEIEDRRGSMMQNAGFGAFTNVNAFSLPQDQPQPRNALPSASSSQANNTRSPSAMDRITSPNGIGFGAQLSGRSPTETNRQGISGVQDHDRNHVSVTQANQRHEHTLNALLTNFDSQFPSQQQGSQSSHTQQEYGSRTGDPGSSHTPDRPQMSAMEEFGLPGLLATIRSANPDVAGLARGQDLTSLGLNLNSPEPLWPTFAGPFAEPGSRPLQPDFTLPECYTVDNVNRLKDKIAGFSDETLFWIFYTQPKDILQEFAASELTVRNWRFHKEHQMWLTKNPSLGEPINMGPEKENGSYVFFNHNAWEKLPLSNFDLHYSQLAPVSTVRPNGQ